MPLPVPEVPMKMRLIALSALFVIAAACKGGGALVKAQEDFATKTCACPDLACLKAVTAEQDAWVAKNGSSAGGSESDGEKLAAAAKKMNDCATKLMTAGR